MSAQTNGQIPQASSQSIPSSTSSALGPIAQDLAALQVNKYQGLVSRVAIGSQLPTSKTQGRKRHSSWKELRGWLNILGVLLIPLLIGIYTIVNNTQQADLAKQQHDRDQNIAYQNHQADTQNQLDQQREATLKAFLDDMTTLYVDKNLRESQPGDKLRIIARAKTLATLHRLDAARNKIVIQFLQDARLIGGYDTSEPYTIIDFSDTDLEDDDLSGTNLYKVILRGTNLKGVNLTNAFIKGTILAGVNLTGADLTGARVNALQLCQAKSLQGIIGFSAPPCTKGA